MTMKILSVLLFTLTFMLTGCSNSTDSINTEKYLSIASAPANSVVPINQYIIVTFSAVINAATVDISSMYIADENEAPIISRLTVDKERVSIIPNEFFLPNKPYTVVVTTAVEDVAGRTLENTFIFPFTTSSALDTTAPTLDSLTPARDTSADKSTDIIMTFDETIAGNGVLQLKESDTNTTVNGTTTLSNNTLIFIPQSDLTPGANYTVTLQNTVEDLAGNSYSGLTNWDFSVIPEDDLMPPWLDSLTPARDTSADKSTDIIMTFDETIAGNGVLQLKESDTNTTVNGTTTLSNNTLIFIPQSDLTPGANYTVTLQNTVEDLAGNSYSGLTNWDFSVNPLIDVIPPTLVSITPVDDTEVSQNTNIIMEFDETIAGNGVLQLKESDTNAIVNGTTIINNNILSFVYSSDLTQDTNYTVTLQNTVEDIAGNVYTGLTSWNFSVLPASSMEVVSVAYSGRVIRVEFSEDLNIASVSENDFAINGGAITFDHLIMQNDYTVKFVADDNISGTEDINVSGSIEDIYGVSHNEGVTAIYNLGG